MPYWQIGALRSVGKFGWIQKRIGWHKPQMLCNEYVRDDGWGAISYGLRKAGIEVG